LAPGVVKQINPAVEEKSHQTGSKTRGGMTQGLMSHWTLRRSEQVILQMLKVGIFFFFSPLKSWQKRGEKDGENCLLP